MTDSAAPWDEIRDALARMAGIYNTDDWPKPMPVLVLNASEVAGARRVYGDDVVDGWIRDGAIVVTG